MSYLLYLGLNYFKANLFYSQINLLSGRVAFVPTFLISAQHRLLLTGIFCVNPTPEDR